MRIRPGVAAVIITADGVLLQRRDDNRMWGLPGGSVDPGESVRAAVIREVLEETGLDVEPVRLVGVYSDPANHQVVHYPNGDVTHYVSTVFECVIRGGTLTTCEESLELTFFPPDALPPDVMAISRIRIHDALAQQVGAFVR
jgi:ADP-ribose pyrophosphatase YjhB (NUDIX family)